MVAAGYAVHGPRTVLVLARPATAGSGGGGGGSDNNNARACVVQECLLTSSAAGAAGASSTAPSWRLARDGARLPPAGRVFAPANLRAAAAGNAAYGELVSAWMAEKYTLRYSGAMVPDVHHALAKGGGVFCSPTAAGAPAKLRLLYEVLPLAFVAEAAGGAATAAGGEPALDRALRRHDERAGVCLGSAEEVARCDAAMRSSPE
jgi:sedoheptulose-bisphosphatase